ncbi:hypothetical protein PCE1_004780 [Barthelona sp. PCE]
MSDGRFREKGQQLGQQAKVQDDAENFEEALNLYTQSIQYFMTDLKYEKTDRMKEAIRGIIARFLDRAEQIKQMLAKPKKVPASGPKRPKQGNSNQKSEEGEEGEGGEDDVDEDTAKLREMIGQAIVRDKPNVRWKDIAGLETAKNSLQEAVIVPIRFPHLFVGKREPWRGILLYGPPGTGKSYIAKAVATEADATFFSVTASDLVSKWQGESEKLVKALFTLAGKEAPSIIFIDEIDALCSTRSENESESSRRIKNEFLVRMQGLGSAEGVLVLGATNLPWMIDSAVRRRFDQRIYITLPDVNARAAMFKIHLGETPNDLSDADFMHMATETEGYSGSDINLIVRTALMEPIRRCRQATHWKVVRGKNPDGEMQDGMLTPCSPSDPAAQEMTMMDIEGNRLLAPLISRQDFMKALAKVPKSVGNEDMTKHLEFTREFGMT